MYEIIPTTLTSIAVKNNTRWSEKSGYKLIFGIIKNFFFLAVYPL